MTVQVCSDRVLYEDSSFAIVREKGTSLFEPSEHGLELGRPVSSLCWARKVCTYRVADGALTLDELLIVLNEELIPAIKEGQGPLLFGQHPKYKRSVASNASYTNLKGPLAFSGGLLLGTDLQLRSMSIFRLNY